MKHFWYLLVAATCLAMEAQSPPKLAIVELSPMSVKPVTASKLVELAKSEGQLTELIDILATSGEICKVRGHAWKTVINSGIADVLHHFNIPDEERTCGVCGLKQQRSMPSWPDETAVLPRLTNVYHQLTLTNTWIEDVHGK